MLTRVKKLPLIQTPLFKGEDWFHHGFGLRKVSLSQYIEAFPTTRSLLLNTHQVHGNAVHIVGSKPSKKRIEGDAFLTDQKGIVCSIQTADCLPILIVDTKKKVVGAVHAGWRGTVAQVIIQAIQTMKEHWKCDVADLKIALGPSVGGHCYRVGHDVIEALKQIDLYPGPWVEEKDRNNWYLDIAFANLHLLERTGVARKNIYVSLACTACDSARFYSCRKEGEIKERQVSFIVKTKE